MKEKRVRGYQEETEGKEGLGEWSGVWSEQRPKERRQRLHGGSGDSGCGEWLALASDSAVSTSCFSGRFWGCVEREGMELEAEVEPRRFGGVNLTTSHVLLQLA